jgi:LuxR family transcriptional regulator, maltose regulon positive regulatory protein
VPLLQEAASRGAVASPLIQVLALGQLCLLAAQEGDWDRASRLAAQGRDQVARCGLADYPSMLMIHACSALVRAHEGRVERAQEDFAHAKLLLERMTDFPPWYEAEAMLTLSRVAVRFHDLEGARSLLDDASRFIDRIPDPGILPAWGDECAAHLEAASSENGGRDWSLTMAELRILQYLPTHLSFREIGERIHISPNTVKTQAQAVYRKLDVSSRAEAVERAEKAGLLGEDP